MTPDPTVRLTTTPRQLNLGDRLLRVGPVTYPQGRDPDATPVFVTGCRVPSDENYPVTGVTELATSQGAIYVPDSIDVTVERDTVVTASTVLLISRRDALHVRLLSLGIPTLRRTPAVPTAQTAAVTAAEWNAAPVVLIDGYLSTDTLATLTARLDLARHGRVLLVSDDPDDFRLDERARAAQVPSAVVQFDANSLIDLTNAAITGRLNPSEHPLLNPMRD